MARLNSTQCDLHAQGGRSPPDNAWFNLTVYFYIDDEGAEIDFNGDIIQIEPFTMKYLIEAENWPWEYETDFLAAKLTFQIYDTVCINNCTLYIYE